MTRATAARERAGHTLARALGRVPGHAVVSDALEHERFAAAGLLAGGLAYRFFLWLVPFGLVVAAVLEFLAEYDETALEDTARRFGLSAVSAAAASDAIEQQAHSTWYFLGSGLVLIAWFGPGALRALSLAHAVAWRLPPAKFRRPVRAGLAFSAIVTALILGSASTAFLRESTPVLGLVVTVAFVLVYAGVYVWLAAHLPNRATDWRAFIPGAVLVAVGAQAVHLLVVIYLAPKIGRSSELYGTLSAATVVLLWLYLIARLLVAAAFLDAALWERSPDRDEVRAGAARDDPYGSPSGS